MPKISILLPIYGESIYLSEAIESVINQSFQDWELIIISDPPIGQKTREIVGEYLKKDPRIKYFENKIKLGFPKSLNRGLEKAQGEYIARIDDDDIWNNRKKIEKQLEFLERNKEYLLVGSGAIMIDERGKEIGRFLEPEKDSEIRNFILYRNPFLHSSTLFCKDVVEKLGGYDETVPGACDYDLWLRLGKIGKFYNFPEFLIRFRMPPSYRNPEKVRFQRIQRTLEKIRIIKRYKKDYSSFYKAFFKDYLKLIYLITLARFSKLDNFLYKKRQIDRWRI